MAVIGHTLVGAALSAIRPASAARTRQEGIVTGASIWPSAAWWPGFLVLGANLLDQCEWVLAIVGVHSERTHPFHTIPAAVGCVLAGSLFIIAVARVRTVGPHLVWAVAVMSHLLMDHVPVKAFIRNLYRLPPPGAEVSEPPMDLWAEFWFYGGMVVMAIWLAALLHANRDSIKWKALALAGPCLLIVFFVPTLKVVWLLGYAVIWGFAAISLHLIPPRAIWLANLLLIAPVVGLDVTELMAVVQFRYGLAARAAGNWDGAAAYFRRSIELPTRTEKAVRWWQLGNVLEHKGDEAAAEAAYQNCVAADIEWGWGRIILADFYLARMRNHPEYRGKAETILLVITPESYPPHSVRCAAARLAALSAQPPRPGS